MARWMNLKWLKNSNTALPNQKCGNYFRTPARLIITAKSLEALPVYRQGFNFW